MTSKSAAIQNTAQKMGDYTTMKMRNNNPRYLEGNNSETITVQVKARGTGQQVAFSHDGATGNLLENSPPLTFTLDKNHDPSILVMVFIYTNLGNGKYEINVTGSSGGSSQYTVTQFEDEALDTVAYVFDVV